MKIILHNKPTIGKEEIKAVQRVLVSGWLAQGKEIKKFEDEFSKYLGFSEGHAAAFSSGTVALYVALVSSGVKKGDEVITPSYVCSAILNAIFMAQAKPVLVDVNREDFNISFEETIKKISSKTKVIIVPHIFGMPADIDKFIKLKIPIIEDCAQAIGAKYKGNYVGTFGKAAIFSFYASKMFTTGYGGMIFSKDKNFIAKAKDYREFDCRKDYKPRFNFQMSDLQAAIGRVQFKKLPRFLKKRKDLAKKYYENFPSDVIWPPLHVRNKEANFYRLLIKTGNPQKIKELLLKKGIKTILPIEIYELLHRYLKQDPKKFPVSERIAKNVLSLPIYPLLADTEVNYIYKSIKKIYG